MILRVFLDHRASISTPPCLYGQAESDKEQAVNGTGICLGQESDADNMLNRHSHTPYMRGLQPEFKEFIKIIPSDQLWLSLTICLRISIGCNSSILAHHLEDGLLSLLRARSVQVVTATLNQRQSR